jgi:endonuclease/exonuclease/phosphatase (EEP) superfamily protein YafD
MNRKRFAHFSATAVLAATVLASVPLVLGFFADRHAALDTLGHFRVHLAVAVAIGGLALMASRFWKHGLLSVALGAAAFWTALPAFPFGVSHGAAASEDAGEQAVYRLLQLNLRFDNRTPGNVLSLIGRTKPDIVTLNEVSAAWKPRIAQLAAMYPYSIVCEVPQRVGGVAILSRRPFTRAAPPRCLDAGSFAIAKVDFGGRDLDVAALHLHWPWPFRQAAQLDAQKPALAGLGNTTLLAGDLNATTWSAAVRRVEADGGLSHVDGIGPTWLDRRFPNALRPYAGLPIDQIFSKGEIAILSARTLDAVGSDHLPILVEFSLLGSAVPDEDVETATAMLH